MYRIRTEDKAWARVEHKAIESRLDTTGFHRIYFGDKLVSYDMVPAILGDNGECDYIYKGIQFTKEGLEELRYINMQFENWEGRPVMTFRCKKTGDLHRVHGPALIHSSGWFTGWYQNGELHRLGGHALEEVLGDTIAKNSYINGKLCVWSESAGKHTYENTDHEYYQTAYCAFKRAFNIGDCTAVFDLFSRVENGALTNKMLALGAYNAYKHVGGERQSWQMLREKFSDYAETFHTLNITYVLNAPVPDKRTEYMRYLAAYFIALADPNCTLTFGTPELSGTMQVSNRDYIAQHKVRTEMEFTHPDLPPPYLDSSQNLIDFIDAFIDMHEAEARQMSARANAAEITTPNNPEDKCEEDSNDGLSIAAVALGVLAGAALKRISKNKDRQEVIHVSR